MLIVFVAACVHLCGVRKDLPFSPEVDEPIFTTISARIAASGNLNPAWFGHPGSTLIYPLALVYRLWFALAHGGSLFHADPRLLTTFEQSPSEFYLLGRLLTMLFAVASVPFIYLVGRRVFNPTVGIIGAWFSILYTVAVSYAQVVRTDSAAVFFAFLSLWLCLRLYERPTVRSHVLAGAAIGLAIGTRYFLVALVPVLLLTNVFVLRRQLAARLENLKSARLWLGVGAGLLGVAAAFALSTPYFFLDFGTAMESLRHEARGAHPGSDGLSALGNLRWYLTEAIPSSITLPQTVFAAFGVVLTLQRREPLKLLLLWFVAVFLAGICLSPLHSQRWLIQVLPAFALFAAYALHEVTAHLTTKVRSSRTALGELFARRNLLALGVVLLSALPAYQLGLFSIGQVNRSTRVAAREWILQNLPADSRIAQEQYAAPLAGTDYVVWHERKPLDLPAPGTNMTVFERKSLAEDRTVDDYRRAGYRYLVISSRIYQRYLAEPERYPMAVAFYHTLFAEGRLLRRIEPSITRQGPTIHIYELPD